MFPVVYCRGKGPDEAKTKAIHVATNAVDVIL